MDFYKTGDYVLVNNYSTDKVDIGRIVEMIEHSSSFTYILFCKPEETYCGRLDYQGKNEVFKTNVDIEESISHIVSKVEILKPQDYSKIPREEKFASDLFVCRQKYDTDQRKFSPELEPDCFCNKILNPDDDLVVCECGRLFHYHCINRDQSSCPTCDFFLITVGDTLYKKRKIEEDNSVLLKTNKEEEFYEMFANALDDVTSAEQQESSRRKTLNDKRPLSALDTNRMRGNQGGVKIAPPKKASRKELLNIDDDAYDRIRHALGNFSKTHQNRGMSDMERGRYLMKEKYYKCLLYGIEEVNQKRRLAGSHLHLSEEARKIALTDSRENYKNAQNLALSIEAVVWHTMNKLKDRMDANYSMKNRELLNYLTDDNNSELRLAVLVGQKKPEFLCQANGKELVSKAMSNKIEKKELKTLKLSLLPDEIKIIAKSHKGETVIEAEEPIPKPTATEIIKEVETAEDDDSDIIEDIVEKIGRGTSELFDSGEKGYNRNSTMEEVTAFDDNPFKNYKKAKQDDDALSDASDHLTGNNYKKNKKMSMNKNYDDPLMSKAMNNKMIDQGLLKSVANFFFEETYNKLTERIRTHLRPEFASDILDEVERKYQMCFDIENKQ